MTRLVALAMDGGPAYVDSLQKVWDEGNAVFPLDTRLPADQQKKQLAYFGVNDVIDGSAERTTLTDSSVLQEGDALVVATSGTSGHPKGVVHTHSGVQESARITNLGISTTAGDHWLACLPLTHIGGLSVIMRAVLTGQHLTILPRFDPDAVMDAARNGARLVSLVNTAMRRVDTTLFDKILLGGAQPVSDRPDNVVTTYGMTETGSGIVYEGTPLDGVQIKTDDEGQLYVRSKTLLRAYLDGSSPLVDGWLPTGDIGSFQNGVVEVLGRKDFVINSGGQKVWPEMVERVLNTHPSVAASLIHGVDDPEWGQRVIAVVEPRPNTEPLSLSEVRDFVKAYLPAYSAPRELTIVTSLPRTASGKVQRSLSGALREDN